MWEWKIVEHVAVAKHCCELRSEGETSGLDHLRARLWEVEVEGASNEGEVC